MSDNYIKSLVQPTARKSQGRKVWAVDLEKVWLPLFVATNVEGDTAVPSDAIGAPIRLAYAKDGSVRFSNSGRPVTQVAKALRDNIQYVKENFEAGLVDHAAKVQKAHPEEYRAQIEAARKAGEPIVKNDRDNLNKAVLAQMEAAAEAEKQSAPAATTPEAATVEPTAQGGDAPAAERELVTAQ